MNPGEGVALTVVLSRAAIGSPTHITRLPLCVAVELATIINRHTPSGSTSTVKWPNDVLVGGRKVAGILIESLDDDRVAIGIGINISGVPGGLPSETITALSVEGVSLAADVLVSALAESVIHRARNLDDDELLEELQSAIDTVGRQVRIELPDGRIVTGRATGLGSTGSLLVETGTGTDEFVAGDVTHLRLGGDDPLR